MKTHGGMDVEIHVFLTSVLDGGELSDPRQVFVPIGAKNKCTRKHCTQPPITSLVRILLESSEIKHTDSQENIYIYI